MLPQAIIESADVHTFQAKLQGILKRLAGQGEQNWEVLFSPRHALHAHPLRRIMNAVVTINSGEWTTEDVSEAFTMSMNVGDDLPPAWW